MSDGTLYHSLSANYVVEPFTSPAQNTQQQHKEPGYGISFLPQGEESDMFDGHEVKRTETSTSLVLTDFPAHHERTSRIRNLSPIFIFLGLEVAFVALAGACTQYNGLVLPRAAYDHQEAVKDVFSIIFIVWQTLAVLPLGRLTDQAFSTEWSYQYRRAGKLVPGVTDRVSTLTAGSFDRAGFILSQTTSSSFKCAFLLYFTLIALIGLGPSSINVNDATVDRSINLSIGNLTITQSDSSASASAIQRAYELTHIEQQEQSSFGYSTDANWIVAWPPLDRANSTGVLQYPTDVVHYDYSCRWEAPSSNASYRTWGINGSWWAVWNDGSIILDPSEAAIYALVTNDTSKNLNGLSAFLLLGGNSTLRNKDNTSSTIDLTGLPTAYNAQGFLGNASTGSESDPSSSPLASALLCDPQMEVTGGQVMLGQSGNLNVLVSGNQPMGNIPPSMAGTIFTQGLVATINFRDPWGSDALSFFATQMFLNTAPNLTSSPPLDIDAINKNMSIVIQSPAKAYVDGYRVGDGGNPSTSTVSVGATTQERRLSLVTSRAFWVTTIGLTVITGILGVLIVLKRHDGPSLSLKSLMGTNQRGSGHLRSTVSVDQLPHADNDIPLFPMESPPLVPNRKREGVYPIALLRPTAITRKMLLIHFAVYVVLELVYIALAIACWSTGGIFISSSIPNSTSIFKAVFILWQSVAAVPAGQIFKHALSSEWATQFDRRSGLEPNVTDRVSTLGSGWSDRIRHVTSRAASIAATFAICGLGLLVAMSSLAPGAIHVGEKYSDLSVPMRIGNLTIDAQQTSDSSQTQASFATARAGFITRLEQVEHFPFGYSTEERTLVGWPSLNSLDPSSTYSFPSDIVRFGHSCSWQSPTFEGFYMKTGPDTWGIQLTSQGVDTSSNFTIAILALTLVNTSRSAVTDVPIAFAFFADDQSSGGSTIDLSGISTTQVPADFVGFSGLSSTLLCDPQYTISGGIITLNTDNTLKVVSEGAEALGNIPKPAADTIFKQGLLTAVNTPEEYATNKSFVNSISAKLFLPNSSLDTSNRPRPLDVPSINANMDAVMGSASKAYMTGYTPSDLDSETEEWVPTANFTTMSVTATKQDPKVALVTSRPLLIATMVLVVIMAIVMSGVIFTMPHHEEFNLGNVLEPLLSRRAT